MHYDVTIGIPVYQAKDYVIRAMTSALEQTYPSIEFLVIDDGSKDLTAQFIRNLQTSHDRGRHIRLLEHAENLGVSETRNNIIREAQGDYLYFMDSDDTIHPDTIMLLMGQINKYDADIAFGSYEKTELNGEKSLYQYPDAFYDNNEDFAGFAYRKYFGIQASACNFLVKTSILQDHDIRFCKSRFWEDTIFTLELVTYIQKAVTLSTITYFYLCREKSLSDVRPEATIHKNEIVQYFETVEELKKRKAELINRPYYPDRCYIAVMSDVYIICNILKRWKHINPSFSNKEMKAYMTHPATLWEICFFKKKKIQNLFLYIIGILPSSFCIRVIRYIGEYKKII